MKNRQIMDLCLPEGDNLPHAEHITRIGGGSGGGGG
jgi:hypothetical protein